VDDSVRCDEPGSASGIGTFTSKSDPEYDMLLPKFFMTNPKSNPL